MNAIFTFSVFAGSQQKLGRFQGLKLIERSCRTSNSISHWSVSDIVIDNEGLGKLSGEV